jgi:hypothetical protein
MKIGVKLVTVIIGIGFLAGVTITLAQREISRLSDEQARAVAAQNSERISTGDALATGTVRLPPHGERGLV